jgi:hypothetical protein
MLRTASAVFMIAGIAALGQAQNDSAGAPDKVDRGSAYYYYAVARMYAEKAVSTPHDPAYVKQAIENYKAAIKADPQMAFLREELSMIEAGRFGYFRPLLQQFSRPSRVQNSQPPISSAKAEKVVVGMVVTDEHGGYIKGLKPSDFRIFEDGIPQEIFTFAEGRKSDDGAREHSYTITYDPDPSNHNLGFRKIDIQIVSAASRHWRVKHRPGYRPDWPKKQTPEAETK